MPIHATSMGSSEAADCIISPFCGENVESNTCYLRSHVFHIHIACARGVYDRAESVNREAAEVYLRTREPSSNASCLKLQNPHLALY